MSVSKDPARGTYYVQCWYRDWTGKRCKKTKRGFKTKKAASAWEVDFLRQMEGTPDMTLNAFYDLYCKGMDKNEHSRESIDIKQICSSIECKWSFGLIPKDHWLLPFRVSGG